MYAWKKKKYPTLTPQEIHDLYQLRSTVFVVEQKCIYLDQDGKDLNAVHVLCFHQDKLVAYGRIIPPTEQNSFFSFGRICVHQDYRGQGLAKQLVQKILNYINLHFGAEGQQQIKISAQTYLREFYRKFGFNAFGDCYDEDGISHIKMCCATSPGVKISSKNLFIPSDRSIVIKPGNEISMEFGK